MPTNDNTLVPELRHEVARLSTRVSQLQKQVNTGVDTIKLLKSEMKGGGKLTTMVQQGEHAIGILRDQNNTLQYKLKHVGDLLKKQLY